MFVSDGLGGTEVEACSFAGLSCPAEAVNLSRSAAQLLPDTVDEHGDDALRGDGIGTRRGGWSPVSAFIRR